MKRKLLPLFLIPVVIPSFAQQKTGSIIGNVKAEQENRAYELNGVIVEAFTIKDTLYMTTVGGIFQFKRVTAGPVTLRFSHISYKDVIKEIEVKPGQTTEVDNDHPRHVRHFQRRRAYVRQ